MRWRTRKDYRFDNGLISQLEAIGCVSSFKTTKGSCQENHLIVEPLKENSKICFILPIKTLSELNGVNSKTRLIKTGKNKGKPAREHWREAWERHKEQKRIVHLMLSPHRHLIQLPCNVKLIRLGPRELDFDNLVASQKRIRDATAEVITQDFVPGRADGDKRIKWEYDQEYCAEYKVKIEIW